LGVDCEDGAARGGSDRLIGWGSRVARGDMDLRDISETLRLMEVPAEDKLGAVRVSRSLEAASSRSPSMGRLWKSHSPGPRYEDDPPRSLDISRFSKCS
jgi:hypothetical protein